MLPATLVRPDGAGPLPAMVLLQTCGGLSKGIFEWANWLKSEGYAALIVDSFSPRGTTDVHIGEESVALDVLAVSATFGPCQR